MDVNEIESAIANLTPSELRKLAKWFEEFHAQVWDQQIERDLKAGRLDSVIEEAKQDLESDHCREL